jgi:hypothetical protein
VGAGGVLLVLAAFLVARPYLVRQKPSDEIQPTDQGKRLLGLMEAGRKALTKGRFRRAVRVLDEAVALRERHPDLLDKPRYRWLIQLQRQADLLARLSLLNLEDIVRQGTLVRDPEERSLQMEDHRGRTFLFDEVLRRDPEGQLLLPDYEVEVGGDFTRKGEVVRLALEDLVILRDLPLDEGPRVIFGARLLRCEREEGGSWVVRFEPNSGVLLTDAEAAEAASPRPLGPGLKEVMQRQQKWLDDLPVQQPARP